MRSIYQVCSTDDPRLTFDFFIIFKHHNFSWFGGTGKILHGVCRFAFVTVSLR